MDGMFFCIALTFGANHVFFDNDDFVLYPNDQIICYFISKGWSGMGRIDVYGRCIPVPEVPWPVGSISNPFPRLYAVSPEAKSTYRYASGRLVPGTVDSIKGFVPQKMGKIITVSEYMKSNEFTPQHSITRMENREYHSESCIEVYNIPGFFYNTQATKQYKMSKSVSVLPFPIQPIRQDMGTKVISSIKYEYVPSVNQNEYIARVGKILCKGHYDFGTFLPDVDKLISTKPPPDIPIWCKPLSLNEPVYELCNGNLIPGFLYQIPKGEVLLSAIKHMTLSNQIISGYEALNATVDDYIFVPDLGGIIIDMPEYLKYYDPNKSRRIHNLSGEIKPVTK